MIVTGKGNYLGEVTRTFAIGTPVEHTLTVGEYFYATLAELGYNVPTNGTPYSVVAKGLPAGLKLKYNPAWKNKKGKVIIKAKSEWWIEGVPTAAMDYVTTPPYLVITANGRTTTEVLPVEVAAQDVKLEDLGLGQTVNEQFYLPGVTNGWTVSGLPTGLKYTAKVIYKDPKAKKKVVKYPAYTVYGKTTKAGLFTVTAKKKVGAYYETMKYRVLVRPKAVDVAVFGESLTNITTMAYVPVEWDLTGGGRGATALPGEDDGHAGRVTLPETTIEAWQNLWGNTYKAVGKALFTTKSGKKTLNYRMFTYTGVDDGVDDGHAGRATLPAGATLSLKVTTAGAVTATLTYDTGRTKKDGKKTVKVYHKPTCSTVVVPTSAPDAETFTGEVHLFFAPSAANSFDGWSGTIPF